MPTHHSIKIDFLHPRIKHAAMLYIWRDQYAYKGIFHKKFGWFYLTICDIRKLQSCITDINTDLVICIKHDCRVRLMTRKGNIIWYYMSLTPVLQDQKDIICLAAKLDTLDTQEHHARSVLKRIENERADMLKKFKNR